MTKVNQLKEELRIAEKEQKEAQREARKTLEPIYQYHTVVTDKGGISVVGILQNRTDYDSHMKKYSSVYDMPDNERRGIVYYLTIDGYVIGDGGGWIQDPVAQLYKETTKVTVEEWELLKKSVYPKKFHKKEIV